jgi:GTP pyrophosphokinase
VREAQVTTISDILETIRVYAPDADLQPVMSAYLLAARAHAGQKRKSGEPYLTHPLAVAKILSGMRMDVDTIATALLHDALEDNPITKAEMEAEIGSEITDLVDGVTKIGKLKFRSKEELAAENFRKMMLAMGRDLRVILVKLADRLHNMRTLTHHRADKQISISRETLDIFVPIANRLGLTRIKSELEDICFGYLEPDAHRTILDFLEETQTNREAYTERVVTALQDLLHTENIDCDVNGRAKHPSSIFRKMNEQHLAVQEVPDLLAFRVLVDELSQCYAVLGLIHAQFPPIPERIKDYIARPKANGYQSLHTTVIGPEGLRAEVQIRTHEMHRVAEDGVAAHWRYKEGHLALSRDDVARIGRIRELFETSLDAESATEFMETIKVEFYSDEVFVFTPVGDVKRFPAGATTLDFAYAVHSDVGAHCTGAKVNGRMVPLRYQMRSGDTIEILTSANQKPSRDWLNIARTGRAISKIRRFLRDEERELGIRIGREILEAELKRANFTFAKLKAEGRIYEVLADRGLADLDSLLVDVARGRTGISNLVTALLPEGAHRVKQENQQAPGALSSLFQRFRTRTESPVLISGADGVLVAFAKCCNPLPGEAVAGFITRGRGITVHRTDCRQLKSLDPERRILVEWDGDSSATHSGEIQIVCTDRPGMLSSISKVCEQAAVNINRAEARVIGDSRAVCILEVSVRDVSELTVVMKNLEKLKGVESVQRMADSR